MKGIGTTKITKGMKITLIKDVASLLNANEGNIIVYLYDENKKDIILRKGKITY